MSICKWRYNKGGAPHCASPCSPDDPFEQGAREAAEALGDPPPTTEQLRRLKQKAAEASPGTWLCEDCGCTIPVNPIMAACPECDRRRHRHRVLNEAVSTGTHTDKVTTTRAPYCALLTLPRAGVEDPRAWCSHLVESCETLGGLGEVLRVSLEAPDTDLDVDGAHRRLWASVSEQVAADLAVACYVLARVATRLAVTGPEVAGCTECEAPAAGACRMCGRLVCGDHRTLIITPDGASGLCSECADDYKLMHESMLEGEAQ